MCKNTSQPSFDPTLKRPGMGHRLRSPFRTNRFVTRTRLTRPIFQVYVRCMIPHKFFPSPPIPKWAMFAYAHKQPLLPILSLGRS